MERRLLSAGLGLYAAALLLPAVLLLGGWSLSSPRQLVVVLSAGLAITIVVTLGVGNGPDRPDRFASLPVAAVTVLPPLAYLPYLVIATTPGSRAAAIAAVGLLSVLPGGAVPLGGAVLRNRRLREQAAEDVVVTVGEGDGDERNWTLIAGMTVMGIGFVAIGAATAVGGSMDVGAIAPALGGLWTSVALLAADSDSEVAVTDVGLRIDRSVTRWADLEGYRVTDDAVELVRRQWYLPTRDFDRDEISDEAALLAGLETYLPRLDDPGRIR
ncbi:MAG: hypothetical protein ABEH59_09115 [Halobacteriales archaeon]